MLTTLLALALAGAAEPSGHYHPTDIGRGSAVFRHAQEVAGTAFQARQERALAIAGALRAWEEALDLLGSRAPATERERLADLTRTFVREHAAVGAEAQARLDAFDAAFRAALDRALAGREAVLCRTGGSGLRLGPGGGRATPCPGADLNAALAATMDRDPALRAAIDELVDDPWPDLTLDARPLLPVGAGAASVDVARAFRRRAGHALRAIEQADEDARLPFEVAIEQGASPDALAGMRAAADEVTATTRARRAALAAPVLAAVDAANARAAKKGLETVSWCAQPVLFGGCDAPVASAELEAAILDARRVTRAWREAADR